MQRIARYEKDMSCQLNSFIALYIFGGVKKKNTVTRMKKKCNLMMWTYLHLSCDFIIGILLNNRMERIFIFWLMDLLHNEMAQTKFRQPMFAPRKLPSVSYQVTIFFFIPSINYFVVGMLQLNCLLCHSCFFFLFCWNYLNVQEFHHFLN